MTWTRMTSSPRVAAGSGSRLDIVRWQAGAGTFGVPQAAAPIAFGLVALPITGTAASGAAMVFAMTTAQVLGSVPIARLGARFNSVRYLRALIAVRTIALAAVTVLASLGAPFLSLIVMVVAAGAVNGAAHGYQRLLLNYLVDARGLPRALGVAATLNEITFALAPVLASLLGAISPVWAMVAMTVLGVGPMVLMPAVPRARGRRSGDPVPARQRFPREASLWLVCAAAGSGTVAAVEVGAVSFALSFDLAPSWAFLFASVLCLGSIAGGVWVSVRNRIARNGEVVGYLAATTAGSALVLTGGNSVLTLAGAAVIGFFLPSLGTFYSLILDRLAPPSRRAEMFALLRTASALGVIAVSGLLALLGLRAALVGSFAALLGALCLVVLHSVFPRGAARAPRRTGRHE
ncbi:MFS transporter [Streptomyces profundus]|uniref:MFS transporter n=1 Tax=Streptomyces profundus TaxID=2867410 RepID=UPI001D16F981|nr:MFS transporter [Streptomyces sp. MA3_2.13]UED86602.1 hypothetical protein K4G22_22385 [Streptomyces sp. MA3_2.13]